MVVGIACRGARVGLYVDVVRVHFSCKPGKLNLRTIFAGAGTNPLCLLRVVRAIGPTTAAHQCGVMTEWKLLFAAFEELSPELFGEPLLSLLVNLAFFISTEPEVFTPIVVTFSLSLKGGCFFVLLSATTWLEIFFC